MSLCVYVSLPVWVGGCHVLYVMSCVFDMCGCLYVVCVLCVYGVVVVVVCVYVCVVCV